MRNSVKTFTLRITILSTLCTSLLLPGVPVLVGEASQGQGRERPVQPRSNRPEGTFPDLDEIKNESHLEREPPAPVPSNVRARRNQGKPWDGRRVGDPFTSGELDQAAANQTAHRNRRQKRLTRRAHASRGFNPPQTLTDTQFIQNFFNVALQRSVTSEENPYWSYQLRVAYIVGPTSLKLAASELGRTLFESASYAARNRDAHWYVYDLYKTYLMRDPDAGGWAFWEGLVSSHGREYVRRGFEESGEFATLMANTVPGGAGSTTASSLISAMGDPRNQPGNGMLTRDASWSVPLLSLPGRNGLDLGLALSYSSMVWTRSGPYFYFDQDNGFPSPGFRLGFPTVQRKVFDAQTAKNSYLLLTPSGYRVQLRQVSSTVYEAADSSYLQLTETSANLLVRSTDGTQLTFVEANNEYRCTQIKDRNGNYITVNYNSLGHITNIVDTLGRVILFNYDTNANLLSITQSWAGQPSHQWVSFAWGTRNMQYSFSNDAVIGTANGAVLPVITQVALNDTSYFTFDYTNSLQVSVVKNYFGAIERNATTFTYQTVSGDVPRLSSSSVSAHNWSGYNNVPAQVTTQYSVDVDGACVLTAPDGTVYKEYYGIGWQKGLTVLSEVWSGGVKQKWTTTVWTQDNSSLTYPHNPRVTEINVYDGSNNRRRTTLHYDNSQYRQYGLPSEVREYAANAGTVIRQRFTDYELSQPYLDRRIIGLVSKVQLTNGSQTLAKTTYSYDDPARLHGLPASATQHDASYTTSFTTRGNVTSASRWDVTDINNTAKKLTSFTNYFTTGSPKSATDPAGHQQGISYADSFSDSVNRNTFAYPTTLTDAGNFSSLVEYNFDLGATTRTQSAAPANQSQGAIQTMTYNNLGQLERVTTTNNGAYKRFWYGAEFAASYTSVNSVADEAYSVQVTDGMGRVIGAVSNHPGSTGGFSLVNRVYDRMGRVWLQSNPTEVNSSWVTTGDDAAGISYTQQTYDWMGRPLVTTNPDLTTKAASYSGCSCAGGEVGTLTDEGTIHNGATKRRQQKIYSDVLGRTVKTEVLNWENGLPYSTTVNTYNALDQITQIRQYAGTSSSSTFQDTTMTYDGYGRLKTRHIPQQDIGKFTSYSYFSDGRLKSVTDARAATTSYQYNNRHLISSITHTAPTGIVVPAAAAFGYDAGGNRLWMTDGLGRVDYEYDQLSRMTAETRTFNYTLPQAPLSNNRYKLSYTYNLAGELKSLEDPFGATINYGRDSRGRLTSVTGSSFGGTTTYANNARYRAWGELKHLEYGNGQQMNATFVQLKPASFTVTGPGQQVVQRQYQYYADGRLRYVQDQLDPKFDRLNEYDHLGRINKARSGAEARGQTEPNHQNLPYHFDYTYDPFGHITGRTGTQWVIDNNVTQTFTNDRQNSVLTDADGRQLFGGVSGFNDPWVITDQYGYDAAGRMVTIDQWGDPPPAEGTSSDPPERRLQRLTSGRDGDGLELKQVVDNFSEDGQTISFSFNKFYLRSSVLGREVVTEVWGDGRKTRTIVYAGGTVLAWQVMRIQASGPDIPEVWWEVRDPGGTMVQMRDKAGVWDSWKVSYAGISMTKAELDSIGTDVGWNDGAVLPPPPLPAAGNFGGGFGWPDPEGDPVLPDGRRLTCVVDGHRTPCANAWALLRGMGIGIEAIKIDGPFSSFLSSHFAITETKRWVSGTRRSHVRSRVDGEDWSIGEVTEGQAGHFETIGFEVSVMETLPVEPQNPYDGLEDMRNYAVSLSNNRSIDDCLKLALLIYKAGQVFGGRTPRNDSGAPIIEGLMSTLTEYRKVTLGQLKESDINFRVGVHTNEPHFASGFMDTGFAVQFQDLGNQVRHFIFYLGAGFGIGSFLANRSLYMAEGSNNPNDPDVGLGLVGTDLGSQFNGDYKQLAQDVWHRVCGQRGNLNLP